MIDFVKFYTFIPLAFGDLEPLSGEFETKLYFLFFCFFFNRSVLSFVVICVVFVSSRDLRKFFSEYLYLLLVKL